VHLLPGQLDGFFDEIVEGRIEEEAFGLLHGDGTCASYWKEKKNGDVELSCMVLFHFSFFFFKEITRGGIGYIAGAILKW
jgi:hypothetical protein